MEKYNNLKEISNILHLSEITLREYIKSGKLKAFKIGRQYLVKEEDLQEYIQRLENKK